MFLASTARSEYMPAAGVKSVTALSAKLRYRTCWKRGNELPRLSMPLPDTSSLLKA